MGIIQKQLSKIDFKDQKCEFFEVELNDGPIIHLQNNSFRIEMNPEEFRQFAVNIVNSANKMIKYKNIKTL